MALIFAQQEPVHPQWLNTLLAFVPWLVIFLFLGAVIFSLLKWKAKHDRELEDTKKRVAELERLHQKAGIEDPPHRSA